MLGSLFRSRSDEERALSVNDYARLWQKFAYNGNQYVVPGGNLQELTALEGADNPIVWACVSVRLMVFADARFAWESEDGQVDEFSRGLYPLKHPWPGGRQRDLLARMEVDASLYGNSYWVRVGNELQRLNPTKVKIITGSRTEGDRAWGERLLGYAVFGDSERDEIKVFLPEEVAHYRPLPDPVHPFRGVSWLNPILADVAADGEMTRYKASYLRNAATPNLVVMFDPSIEEDSFERVVETIKASHTGVGNAFKTLYLAGATDVKTVGANFEELAMQAVQGAGETRIAAAAGVPAPLVGISEGLKGSSLNSGNYGAARRRFADGTIRYLWGAACESLETLVAPPTGRRLWINERAVLFMQEDVLDAAKVRQTDAITLRQLAESGFDPQSAIEFVAKDNISKLKHTGNLSVQLQPPGTDSQSPASDNQGDTADGNN